jgi:hypothetical protein
MVLDFSFSCRLMFNFNNPKSIISGLHFLHLRFSSVWCSKPVFCKETLNGCFTLYDKCMLTYLLLGSVVLLRTWSQCKGRMRPSPIIYIQKHGLYYKRWLFLLSSVQYPSVDFSTYVVFRGEVITFTHSRNLEDQGALFFNLSRMRISTKNLCSH